MKIEFYISHKANVLGGTLLSLVPSIGEADLLLTGSLGAIGAFFSFVASLIYGYLWKRILRFFEQRKKDQHRSSK